MGRKVDGKVCTRCKIKKTNTEFYEDHNRSKCKVCIREVNKIYRRSLRGRKMRREYERTSPKWKRVKQRADRKSKYGIDEETFDQMIVAQSKKCCICQITFSEETRETWACVDHNHQTGEVRGILCPGCNIGLGGFKDDPRLLEAAIGYLKEKN